MKCECGCGQITAVASMTKNSKGIKKGDHYRFVHNHHARLRGPWNIFDCGERDAATGCLIWSGGLDANGYGVIVVDSKKMRAHRVAFERSIGPIPDGMLVCHACDNRACIEPSHLWVGTNAQNLADMAAKDRSLYGSRSRQAKITEEVAAAILSDQNASVGDLAEKYGVSRTTIYRIQLRRGWVRVGPKSTEPRRRGQVRGERCGRAKLSDDDVRSIRLARSLGETVRSVADRFNTDSGSVSRIEHRRSWAHVQ